MTKLRFPDYGEPLAMRSAEWDSAPADAGPNGIRPGVDNLNTERSWSGPMQVANLRDGRLPVGATPLRLPCCSSPDR